MEFDALMLTLAWVAILFLALAVYGLARRLVSLQASLAPARAFHSQAVDPTPILPNLNGRNAVVFASPSCVACLERITDLASLSDLPANIVLVGEEDLVPVARALPTVQVPVGTFDASGVVVTPYGLVLDGQSTIWDGPLSNPDVLNDFVSAARQHHHLAAPSSVDPRQEVS